jgi:hypothetical protein
MAPWAPCGRGCGSCGNPGRVDGGRDFQGVWEGPGAGGVVVRSFPYPVSFHSLGGLGPGTGSDGGQGTQAVTPYPSASAPYPQAAASRSQDRREFQLARSWSTFIPFGNLCRSVEPDSHVVLAWIWWNNSRMASRRRPSAAEDDLGLP